MKIKTWNTKRSRGVSFGDRTPSAKEKTEEKKGEKGKEKKNRLNQD